MISSVTGGPEAAGRGVQQLRQRAALRCRVFAPCARTRSACRAPRFADRALRVRRFEIGASSASNAAAAASGLRPAPLQAGRHPRRRHCALAAPRVSPATLASSASVRASLPVPRAARFRRHVAARLDVRRGDSWALRTAPPPRPKRGLRPRLGARAASSLNRPPRPLPRKFFRFGVEPFESAGGVVDQRAFARQIGGHLGDAARQFAALRSPARFSSPSSASRATISRCNSPPRSSSASRSGGKRVGGDA